MPDKQRTIEEQAARNRRGQQLKDLHNARYGSIYRRGVILALDNHLGWVDTWELSFADLAFECEMSVRQAYRSASELREMGLIHFEETETNSGRYRFRVIRSNVAELAEESGQVPPRRKRGRPKTGAEKSCLSVKTCDSQAKHATVSQNLRLSVKTCDSQANALLVKRPLTPTTPSTPAGKPPATLELVEGELLKIGMFETGKPLEKIRETGCRPDQALTVIAFWERFPGRWSVGKLRRRLINLRPGQDADELKYWPPEDAGWQREEISEPEPFFRLTDEQIEDLIHWALSRNLNGEQRRFWEELADLEPEKRHLKQYENALKAAHRARGEKYANAGGQSKAGDLDRVSNR